VIHGSKKGLSATAVPDQFWSQATVPELGSGARPNERFGAALVIANFGSSSHEDLAVASPSGFDPTVTFRSGDVNVIYGTQTGLAVAPRAPDLWHQDQPGIEDAAEGGDGYGAALGAGDYDDNGRADLAVGVVSENVSGSPHGAVNVIYGKAGGLSATGAKPDQLWHQDSTDVEDDAEHADSFGQAVW
jgi:hypothetical protein